MNPRITTTIVGALALLVPATGRAQVPSYPDYPPRYEAPPAERYRAPPSYDVPPPPPRRAYPPPYQAPPGGRSPYQAPPGGHYEAPPYHGYPPYPGEGPHAARPEGYTYLRVVPPFGGTVLVYDRREIIGRFDRAGSMAVPAGQPYRVVAMRGPALIWSGYITASGPTIDLRWDARAEVLQSYEQPPVMDAYEHRELLIALGRAWDDTERLRILREETRQRWLLASQVDAILARFGSERLRLRALDVVHRRIVDPEQAGALRRYFRSGVAQRRADELLGWW